ncbi:alcohol dehydrogenase catalytic domain-containing protein [Paenibacillus aurantius]|uniref:Alcohol dehydrogenase catalytic domain-containing protein n=1 Tax=Paenibacillus aurantius TaxID=2918900 RepID=A0AA96LDW5_9BACL|nr:alcohol dehydrogenase catalytic domain-containing protein [Paenibacillus aurantius]WJH36123.1 alcohol dehydrogenase catalytic domain-containing protein [Paenibacillus sp. CC-CFT747]WNQ11404.1 alcohol dehydrogenase catalytic domain-containing protein [Paenibacillus aurantius]
MKQANLQQNGVKSRAYRLVQPHEVVETALEHELREWEVAVEPTLGSICHADLRYFSGQRRPEALKKKLPMALIHEGIGTIVESGTSDREIGQRVVVVPNIQGYLLNGTAQEECCPSCQDTRNSQGSNYCQKGRFLGSGFDGIAQSRLVVPSASAIPVPDEVPDEIAVLTELSSVSYQALHHVKDLLPTARVVVFGDGPVGYLAAAMLHHVYGVSEDRLTVFGAVPEKLGQFDFATRHLVQEYDFSAGGLYDVALECTGGRFSESAINQAIDVLKPGGHLILMGVTEERVPINTRDVLEKGLTLRGSSRSSIEDFLPVLEAMKDPRCQDTLRKLLPSENTVIRSAEDFAEAMEYAENNRGWKKVLLDFEW